MLPNSPALLPRSSTVVRPQFAGALTAYAAKFRFQNINVPVAGGLQLLVVNADPTRVGIVFTGPGPVAQVDTVAYAAAGEGHGFTLGPGVRVAFDNGTDFGIIAAQQQWFGAIPAGEWLTVLEVFALPVG